MKKIFSTFAALGLLVAATSCSQENDVIAPQSDNVPDGMVLANLNVTPPTSIRTRALQPDLPLWGLFDSWDNGNVVQGGSIRLQYAVYNSDGSIFTKCGPDEGQTITAGQSSFNVSIALPAGVDGFKIFCWADKGGYTFDPEAKTVAITDDAFSSCSLKGDGFYYWGDLREGQNSITLKRPFVQVNLLTNENIDGPLESVYKDGIGADCGLKSEDNNKRYVPAVWHFDTDTFEMEEYGAERSIYSYTFWNVNNRLGGKINGKLMNYAGCFYLFAPQTKKAWVDETTKTTMTQLGLSTYEFAEESAISSCWVWLPEGGVKANQRINIYADKDINDGKGILSVNSGLTITINSTWEDPDTDILVPGNGVVTTPVWK